MRLKYERVFNIDKKAWREDEGCEANEVEAEVIDRIDNAIESEIGDYLK